MPVSVYTEYPFGKGNLTINGIQYSAEATSTTNTYKTVESITVGSILRGTIVELELGITWSQKSSAGNDRAVGHIQARNKGGTWVTLMTEKANAAVGTGAEEWTYSGRFKTTDDIKIFPFDVRVQVKSDSTNDNAVGKVKNSSYVRVTYYHN